jgi:hypothetical protein
MSATTDRLYEDWYQLEEQRVARVASAETAGDVAAVEQLCAAMRDVVAEIERLYRPADPERVAAVKAAPKPELQPDPRQPVQAAARKRPRAPMMRAVGVRVAP